MEGKGWQVGDAPIPVLLCSDRRFCQHMAVTIASLLKNNAGNRFRLIVILDQYDAALAERLRTTVNQFDNAQIEFKVFETSSFAHFRVGHHISLAAYLRLFITSLVDPDIDKLIYLDSDLVVRGDIRALWNTDVSRYFLGAVADPYSDNHENLGFRKDEKYFNSGVLLVNVAKWREENVLPKFISYAEKNAGLIRWYDQCVLNAVFRGQVLFLPYRWNFPARNADLPASALDMSKEEFAKLRKNPSIVHYTTSAKPWLYVYEPHYKCLYYEYLALTPWRDFAPPDFSFAAALKKFFKMAKLKQALKWHAPELFRSVRDWTGLGDPFLRKV